MKTLNLILRILFAIILLVFSMNKISHFLPMELEPGPAADFWSALEASGYIIPIIIFVEVFTAIALLANRFVPLSMILFAPVSLNILLYGIFLNQESLPIGGFTFLLNLYFLVVNRKSYQEFLRAERSR